MTLAVLLTIAAVVISAANFLVLLASYRRAGQWKDSEEAKRLMDRVASCEGQLSTVKGVGDQATGLSGRLGLVEGDVAGLKVRMENVATKADIARLAGDMAGIGAHVTRVESGVERIEGFLMDRRNP